MGLLLTDYVEPQDASAYFRTPWRMCTNATAVSGACFLSDLVQ